MHNDDQERVPHHVAEIDEWPEKRVKTVTAGKLSMVLTHIGGEFFAMDNPPWITSVRIKTGPGFWHLHCMT